MSAQPEKNITIDAQGFLYDEETGEVFGHTNTEGDFHIQNRASAEWVLEKWCEAEAELLALDARLKAITDNIRTQAAQQQRRLAWLRVRFAPELEAYARANLVGKSKTWVCDYGKVSFRKTQELVKVTDEKRALEWVKGMGVEGSVKAEETILLSKIKDLLIADPPPPGFGLEIVPAGEKTTIETGVNK